MTVDKWGIKQIYPTSTVNVQEWYVDMASPTTTPRFTNLPAITMVSETDDIGGTKALETSATQVRMEANSVSGKKALNVEITSYSKWTAGSNANGYMAQDYGGRGGHHSDSTPERKCMGSAYKGAYMQTGTAKCRKEVEHPNYASSKNEVQATTKPLKGHWIGRKTVIYNIVENGKTYPKIEVYVDDGCDLNGTLVVKGNETRWRKVTEYVDRGGWSADSTGWNTTCPPLDSNYAHTYRKVDEIMNTSGMVGFDFNCIAVWRTDDVTMRWKYLSAREITTTVVVPPTDTTAPTLTITTPTQGQTISGPTTGVVVNITGTASDASGISVVEVSVDAGTYSAATGTTSWSKSVTITSSGNHTITVRAVDKAANMTISHIALTQNVTYNVSLS